eukprot:gene7159-biopygen12018
MQCAVCSMQCAVRGVQSGINGLMTCPGRVRFSRSHIVPTPPPCNCNRGELQDLQFWEILPKVPRGGIATLWDFGREQGVARSATT